MTLPGLSAAPLLMSNKTFDPSTPFGTFTQGGYYMGSLVIPDDGEGGKTWALIVASVSDGQSNLIYSNQVNTPGAASLTNGFANSIALEPNTTAAAAIFCRALTVGGFTDWYLPSVNEALAVVANNSSLAVGEQFGSSTLYWSSTQVSSSNARIYRGSGTTTDGTKNTARDCRAMRRVLIG